MRDLWGTVFIPNTHGLKRPCVPHTHLSALDLHDESFNMRAHQTLTICARQAEGHFLAVQSRSHCKLEVCLALLRIFLLACRKKPAGAMWTRGAQKPSGGRCWAEVYCGSAESGSWVHVDPLSGLVDRRVCLVISHVKFESTEL